MNSVEPADGTEHIFLNPVTEFEDYLSLSPAAPLAQAAMGHKKGDIFLDKKVLRTVVDIDEG